MWIIMAVLSAVFAGATAILAKCGINHTDSDVATAIRTIIVLIFSWIMVFVAGSEGTIGQIGSRSLLFLFLSGLATGLSWICYFKALSMADVNKVVPVDKSSTILSIILAIIIFGETSHLFIRITGVILIGAGIFMMIEKKEGEDRNEKGWMLYAVLSAVFAALTSILAKVGITGVESNLGTAIRTCVVLIMSWLIVFGRKKADKLRDIRKSELLFICLSGLTTGASWLCYYYAIQNGAVSVVVPIDKLSIIVTVLFSGVFLKEAISRKAVLGLTLMVTGTLLMAIFA